MATSSSDVTGFSGHFSPRSSHSRSASWSYTRGDGQINLSSHLEPLTSVIRELGLGFGPPSRPSYSDGEIHRENISNTVYVDIGEGEETREHPRVLSRHHSTVETSNSSQSDFDSTPNDNTSSQNNGNGNGRTNGDRMEFQGTIKWIENSVPFLLLLLSRIMWDHRLGILVGVGLTGTFLHANNTIKRQVSLKDKRLNRISVWTILFLCGNVCFIYYVFHSQKLQRCLVFQLPNFSKLDVWVVFWCVLITDYVIRMVTMALKSLVIIVHKRILPFKNRGKYYLLLENTSQFYRILTPIPLWYQYFTNYNIGGEYFAIFSTAFYFLLKARIIRTKLRDLYSAVKTFQCDVQYGTAASKEQINKLGNICPICQEEFSRAISLRSCKHTFCDDCISLWFDREQTCPLCRAKVVGDPSWRDGSTTAYIQLF
ncbi:E3 ubiquitin-protein ligase RNFT1-like [Dendronephthya gigantea]|uniref:E3 ubiquitin-protein ligase RNFT1-like n=1 Tax=Dendronephthya gigantea TaxID=151771 RepID=UPI00106DBEF5|nr:E3 ubiquitin-protein ligase RNFT1-like [Dendronephthya gigantea]